MQGKKQLAIQNDWLIARHIATSTEATLQSLAATTEGLDEQQVAARQSQFGPNEIAVKKHLRRYCNGCWRLITRLSMCCWR